MKTETPGRNYQKRFNFSPPQPRPFLANLPARIDTYEEGVARYFQWRTGLDYYLTIDQIVDFVVNTGRIRVIDLLTDTATFALRLAGRKAFPGRIYSFDSNITLLERAKQRAAHLNLQESIEFKHFQEPRFPIPDAHGDVAVSVFDLHHHPVEEYLAEALRILAPDGHLIVAEILEPKSTRISWQRIWRRLNLKFIQKNPTEANAVYYDREEIIELFFKIGFRQVIIQGLNVPESPNSGVFSLIAATK
ncbi:MAG: methyltransferase domain-containing protein [Acidobacteriota bacterium]